MKQKLLSKALFLLENKGYLQKTFRNKISPRLFLGLKLTFFFLLLSPNLRGQISVTPASLCAGASASVSISIRVNGGVSPYTVTYRIGTGAAIVKTNYISTTPIAVPLPASNTTYTVTSIVDKTGATIPVTGTGNVTINILPKPGLPTITADGPTAFCEGGSVTLTSSLGTTYRWMTPQGILTTQSITASTAGNYSVQVTNANGCNSATSVAKTIEITPFPTAPIIESVNQPTCSLNIGAIVLSGLPAGNWTINPGSIAGTGTTATIPNLNSGNYQFSVVNANGCESELSEVVSIQSESSAPSAPILNTSINSCQSFFNQTWEAVDGATGYQLDVSASSDFSTFLSGYENKTLGNVTSETVTGVIPGVVYFVRLRTISDCGTSSNSLTSSVDPLTTVYNNGTWSNGLPDATKSIVFESNFNADSNLNGCSCTVKTGVAVTVNSGVTLKLENGLYVQGNLTFENNASLVQVNEAINTGEILYKRTTSPVRRYDFTYWSSPITKTPGFTLKDLSPNTLGDKYYSYNPSTNSWVIHGNGAVVMAIGQSYSVRAPQSFDINVPSNFTAQFAGVPNNGSLAVNTISGKWHLIGNPYPSAIDAEKLYVTNPNIGSLYFWTHKNLPSSSVPGDATYNYTTEDYAVLNLTGSIKTSPTLELPSGFISAAQGFFTKPDASAINFTNEMRVQNQNTQFFKTNTATVAKNRIWLNFTNTQGAFKQALIGYVEGATNGIETNYDAVTMNGNAFVDFYSFNGINTSKLTIQGRALPFEESDIVLLGYKSTIAGTFTIALDKAEGIFEQLPVYLEDKTTNTFHNLTCANYSFDTAIGTFNDRFVIHYTNDNKPALLAPIATNSILNCTETSYTQEWSVVKGAKKYKIDVATDANFTTFLAGYQDKELENVTSETITGIVPGTAYFVRVRAVNDCGSSLNSNVVTPQLISTTYENGTWTNGFPDSSKGIIFNSDYTLSSDINGCSCQVNAGASVVVNSGVTLKLQNGLNVEGNLTFENNASLVQINEAVNTGEITYKRYTTPMVNFDWTAWSSPVAGFTLYRLSPNTLADKYIFYNPISGWQTSYNGVAVMQPGKGYHVRTPKEGVWPNGETVVFPYSQLVSFKGVPNNGTIYGESFTPNHWHLIGNPYPSALDIETFLEENSGLYGTISIRNHNTPITNNQYSPNDNSIYNFLGGIAGAEPGQGVTSSKPTGKIAAGQSFFAFTWGTGTITFNNGMRVLGENSQFFKTANTKKSLTDEKHRIWLNLTNTSGGFRQILIGYATNATNDYDRRYDSDVEAITTHIRFYSISQNVFYDIQGRALPFDNTDTVPLGYSATVAGTHTIAIDEVDGLFIDQDIYLEDKTTSTFHNLKNGSYSFSTVKGIFNDRFVIHYTNSASTGKKGNITENQILANEPLVSVEDNQIKIYAFAEKIKQIDIFDSKGSLVYTNSDINASNFGLDKSPFKKQLLIVKTTLQNGKINSAKIVL